MLLSYFISQFLWWISRVIVKNLPQIVLLWIQPMRPTNIFLLKTFSLKNSQWWYLKNTGSIIYLVPKSCFSKLVPNFEIGYNWISQWEYLNKEAQNEIGKFDKIWYLTWTYWKNWISQLNVITMDNSFEMWLNDDEVTAAKSFEIIKSHISMFDPKHLCNQVFLEV